MPDPTTDANSISRSKPIEILTLVVVLVGMFAGGAKFLLLDWPQANLDREKAKIEVAHSKAESLTVSGQIFSPDLFISVDGVQIALCPVFVKMSNTGSVPIQLKKIEFRVFVAPLRDISSLARIRSPNDKLVLASAVEGDAPDASESDTYVGTIASDSPKWEEKTGLSRTIELNTQVPPGQSRNQKLHLLTQTRMSSVMTKIEVLIHTSNSTLRWYGFANPAMCAPAAFSPSASEAPAPAPPVRVE